MTAAATPQVVWASAMPAGTPEVPVTIVGAGACGLTAAIFLREAGIECALLERDARPQGSTALSSGFIPAAGTRVQRAAGVHGDDAARFAADIEAKAQGRAAPHLVRAYAEAITPALDALHERHGMGFELLDGFLYPGHAVRRMHALPERTGAALVAALEAAALAAGAMIVTGAQVHELWCERSSGRIVGVGYRRPNGTDEYLTCSALLLACNGFGGNAAMVREFIPEMRDAIFAGHVGNDGSAVAWGRALGATLRDLSGYQGHGSWAVPQGVLITWALMMEGGIQVNARGERFHDETAGYSEASVEVLKQPGGIAWNVFDDRLLALGRTFPDFAAAESAGAVRHAADVGALASLIGCASEGGEEGEEGEGSERGDRAEGRERLAATLTASGLAAPYHAVKVTGALFHTQGGLEIDAMCRVLRAADGTPFPNLLAAGGAARGVSGDAVWGYLSGNGLLSAVAGGFIAARTLIPLSAQSAQSA
jgi:fumarate reductase flavoprotein subunit